MRLALISLALTFAAAAHADEQWNSNYGDVIYEADHGSVAVLSFPGGHPGHRVHIYVEGLGGNYYNRGVFSGYWVAPEQGDCPREVMGEDGLESNAWGSATVRFDNPGFPSSFTAELMNCYGEEMDDLRAIAPGEVASTQAVPNGLYSGADFGSIEFSCETLTRCRGVYEDGQSFLYIWSNGPNGHFIGTWAEPDSNQACAYNKDMQDINTSYWGAVEMYFDEAAETWTGAWSYCDEAPTHAFNGARVHQRGDPPEPLGGDDISISRFLGSWLPAPDSGARRNDMYTFNPDGTRTVSDGSGMHGMENWSFNGGNLTIEGRPVDLDLVGNTLILSGTKMERATLWGEEYAGRYLEPGIESYGVFAPLSDIVVGDYSLHLIVLGEAIEFQSHISYPGSPVRPILVEFWNDTETIKMAESGNAYRDDVVLLEPETYQITSNSLKFYGTHPEWGEIFFNGSFDAARSAQGPGPDPVITGDLMVKGFIFRDIALLNEGLH